MATTFQFDVDRHRYEADGVEIPSVTQILGGVGLQDYSGVPRQVLERKARIGEAVHRACQYFDLCGDMEMVLALFDAPEHHGYIAAYAKWKSEVGFVPRLVEHQTVATLNGMRYGMKLDREGLVGGEIPYLIELKCAVKEERWWKLQLAFYDLGIEKAKDGIRQRAALQLKPDGTFKIFSYADAIDYDVAGWALGVETWKRNR